MIAFKDSSLIRSLVPVNEQLIDRTIRHAILIERLKVKEARAAVRLFDRKVVPDLMEQLERRLSNIATRGFDTGPATTKRLRLLIKQTKAVLEGGTRELGNGFKKKLNGIAVTEAQFQAKMIGDVIPLVADILVPPPNMLNSIVTSRPFQGRFLREWFDDLGKGTQRLLVQELQTGLVQGESVPQLVRRIRGTNGLLSRTRHSIERIVRTSVTHVTTQAREMTYEQNSDLIKGVQFVATLDSRTTEICMSLDGKVFPINEGERPPVHHQCRSTTVPVTKSFKELGIPLKDVPPVSRASMNGQVSAKVTYPQWLKSQTKKVQDEALGKGKADLFRAGRLDISKFSGVGSRPLSLEQLRKREDLPRLAKPGAAKPGRPAKKSPPIPAGTRMHKTLGKHGLPAERPSTWSSEQWRLARQRARSRRNRAKKKPRSAP